MPSGAKKRKAAKRKKENQSNNHSNPSSSVSTRSHEKENVNHQGEKEIKIEHDGGSSGSTGSSNNSSDNESHVIKGNQAAADIAPVVDPVKIAGSSSERSTKAIDHVPVEEADNSVVENGKRKLSSSEDKCVTTVPLVNAALEEEEPIVQSVHNTAAILVPKECVTQENDDRLTLQHNAPSASDGSGVTEPLLVPSPLPVQKTSWKSCCGLFEVFSGSDP